MQADSATSDGRLSIANKGIVHVHQQSRPRCGRVQDRVTGIYAMGAHYDEDFSGEFIANNIAGPSYDNTQAQELHQFMRSLKVGDIVYIKSAPPSSANIMVKGVEIIIDDLVVTTSPVVSAGRNIKGLVTGNSYPLVAGESRQ